MNKIKLVFTVTVFALMLFSCSPGQNEIHVVAEVTGVEADTLSGFDVVYDNQHNRVHFVYRDKKDLYYTFSDDKGNTWSTPVLAFRNARSHNLEIAPDGGVHILFNGIENDNYDGDAIIYSYLTKGKWAVPDTIMEEKDLWEICPRFTFDRQGNLHLLVWTYKWPGEDKQCCVYFQKPKNASAWDTPEYWCDTTGILWASHGAITTAQNGDIHAVTTRFAPNSNDQWHLQYRVRKADGTWKPVKLFRQMGHSQFIVGDCCFDIKVNHLGKVYIASYTSWGDWHTGRHGQTIWSCTPGDDSLRVEQFIPEYWETGANMLIMPDNNIYLATGNWGWEVGDPVELRKAGWFHYNCEKNEWGKRVHVSGDPATINVHSRFDMTPQWMVIDNTPVIVYAEKLPDEKFKFYLKRIIK